MKRNSIESIDSENDVNTSTKKHKSLDPQSSIHNQKVYQVLQIVLTHFFLPPAKLNLNKIGIILSIPYPIQERKLYLERELNALDDVELTQSIAELNESITLSPEERGKALATFLELRYLEDVDSYINDDENLLDESDEEDEEDEEEFEGIAEDDLPPISDCPNSFKVIDSASLRLKYRRILLIEEYSLNQLFDLVADSFIFFLQNLATNSMNQNNQKLSRLVHFLSLLDDVESRSIHWRFSCMFLLANAQKIAEEIDLLDSKCAQRRFRRSFDYEDIYHYYIDQLNDYKQNQQFCSIHSSGEIGENAIRTLSNYARSDSMTTLFENFNNNYNRWDCESGYSPLLAMLLGFFPPTLIEETKLLVFHDENSRIFFSSCCNSLLRLVATYIRDAFNIHYFQRVERMKRHFHESMDEATLLLALVEGAFRIMVDGENEEFSLFIHKLRIKKAPRIPVDKLNCILEYFANQLDDAFELLRQDPEEVVERTNWDQFLYYTFDYLLHELNVLFNSVVISHNDIAFLYNKANNVANEGLQNASLEALQFMINDKGYCSSTKDLVQQTKAEIINTLNGEIGKSLAWFGAYIRTSFLKSVDPEAEFKEILLKTANQIFCIVPENPDTIAAVDPIKLVTESSELEWIKSAICLLASTTIKTTEFFDRVLASNCELRNLSRALKGQGNCLLLLSNNISMFVNFSDDKTHMKSCCTYLSLAYRHYSEVINIATSAPVNHVDLTVSEINVLLNAADYLVEAVEQQAIQFKSKRTFLKHSSHIFDVNLDNVSFPEDMIKVPSISLPPWTSDNETFEFLSISSIGIWQTSNSASSLFKELPPELNYLEQDSVFKNYIIETLLLSDEGSIFPNEDIVYQLYSNAIHSIKTQFHSYASIAVDLATAIKKRIFNRKTFSKGNDALQLSNQAVWFAWYAMKLAKAYDEAKSHKKQSWLLIVMREIIDTLHLFFTVAMRNLESNNKITLNFSDINDDLLSILFVDILNKTSLTLQDALHLVIKCWKMNQDLRANYNLFLRGLDEKKQKEVQTLFTQRNSEFLHYILKYDFTGNEECKYDSAFDFLLGVSKEQRSLKLQITTICYKFSQLVDKNDYRGKYDSQALEYLQHLCSIISNETQTLSLQQKYSMCLATWPSIMYAMNSTESVLLNVIGTRYKDIEKFSNYASLINEAYRFMEEGFKHLQKAKDISEEVLNTASNNSILKAKLSLAMLYFKGGAYFYLHARTELSHPYQLKFHKSFFDWKPTDDDQLFDIEFIANPTHCNKILEKCRSEKYWISFLDIALNKAEDPNNVSSKVLFHAAIEPLDFDSSHAYDHSNVPIDIEAMKHYLDGHLGSKILKDKLDSDATWNLETYFTLISSKTMLEIKFRGKQKLSLKINHPNLELAESYIKKAHDITRLNMNINSLENFECELPETHGIIRTLNSASEKLDFDFYQLLASSV